MLLAKEKAFFFCLFRASWEKKEKKLRTLITKVRKFQKHSTTNIPCVFLLRIQESTGIIQPVTLTFSRFLGIEMHRKIKTGFLLIDSSSLTNYFYHFSISPYL